MNWKEDHQQRVAQFPEKIREAHTHCSSHRAEIEASEICGCFYCCETCKPSEIQDWVDENAQGIGQTALCPRCGIDSVIGSKSGFPIEVEFLSAMNRSWFGRVVPGPSVKRTGPIPQAWQSYRRRNWLAVVVLIGGLPGTFALVIAAMLLFHLPQSDLALFLVVGLWCIALGWAAFRVVRWPCPRCGAAWLSNQELRLGARRACANCGLGLYEQP